MGRRRRPQHTAIITFLLLLFSALSSSTLHSDARTHRREASAWRLSEEFERVARKLIGPGSSPPSCRSKCGRCAPCRPVHVPIQPGLNKPLEYYPEAWRCKCGNTLFMP